MFFRRPATAGTEQQPFRHWQQQHHQQQQQQQQQQQEKQLPLDVNLAIKQLPTTALVPRPTPTQGRPSFLFSLPLVVVVAVAVAVAVVVSSCQGLVFILGCCS